jgi:protein-S-isoprenylcysteine O-methyltransferase Ste14
VPRAMDRRIVAWAEISLVFLALYLGVPLAGLSIDRGLGLEALPTFVRLLGFAFLLVGVAGLAWCFSLFAGARGTPNPRLPPSRLVTSGPYAWTRNPIAGSHFLAVLGLALVVGSPTAVLIVFILGIPANLVIRHEERTLELRFGAEYRAYRDSVPRWIPRRPSRHR